MRKNIFVVYRSLGNSFYLSKDNEHFEIDSIGNEVWSLMDGGQTENEIIETIAKKYSEDMKTVKTDVNSFLRMMVEYGLVDE